MHGRKYSTFLTVLLVIIIIAIVGLLGFLGYNFYIKNATTNSANEYVDTFDKQVAIIENPEETSNTGTVTEVPQETPIQTENNTSTTEQNNTSATTTTTSSATVKKTSTYKGFEVLGTIEIPATKVKYPILAKLSKQSLDTAVVAIYPREVNLNTPGNVVIAGHNYRNGTFFSNNKKLSNGDKIYITDLNGNKVTYIIYNKYETDENDTKSYNKDTNGKMEITLSTCTDNSKARIIIEARAE